MNPNPTPTGFVLPPVRLVTPEHQARIDAYMAALPFADKDREIDAQDRDRERAS